MKVPGGGGNAAAQHKILIDSVTISESFIYGGGRNAGTQ
jgi:hypothetical protein